MTSHALPSFWKCYEQLPKHIQKPADKSFALFSKNPRHNGRVPEIIWKQGAESDLLQVFGELEERREVSSGYVKSKLERFIDLSQHFFRHFA